MILEKQIAVIIKEEIDYQLRHIQDEIENGLFQSTPEGPTAIQDVATGVYT